MMFEREKINRAIEKKFNALCADKNFRGKWGWFHFLIIANSPYVPNPLPKFSGDRFATVAYREYARQMIRIYAPRKKLDCGHFSRKDHCLECIKLVEQNFEAMKLKRVTARKVETSNAT